MVVNATHLVLAIATLAEYSFRMPASRVLQSLLDEKGGVRTVARVGLVAKRAVEVCSAALD